MAQVVIRIQKLKSAVAVRRSMKHAFREQDTPNADPERTPDNTHTAATSVADGLARFAALLPDKVRKNAVQAVEYVITAGKTHMDTLTREQQDAYLFDGLKFIQDKHGAENVVMASIHRDERAPHLTAIVVPIDKRGRLNCRAFYGEIGALNRLQTEFAEKVGKRHQLERGIEGSKATHTTIREFYAGIQQDQGQVTISPQAVVPRPYKAQGLAEKLGISTRTETPEAVADRLTKAVREGYAPTVAAAAGARLERTKAKQAQDTAASLQRRLQPVLEAFSGLSKEDQSRLLASVVVDSRQMKAKAQAEQARKLAERQAARPPRGHDRGR
jgi:hypothetical protein